jgi:alpha-beta hydrolase superfamily lysophospholipase
MKVSFKNKKGQKLVGILDEPEKKSSATIIMLHGMNAHKEYYSFMNHTAKYLVMNGFSVLRFDFNTHGESYNNWKNFTRESCAEDFETAIQFVKKQGVKNIGVFATSMGTEAFIMKPENVNAAVLVNAFLLKRLWKEWFGPYIEENKKRGNIILTQHKTKRILRYGLSLQEEVLKYPIEKNIQKVKCPSLMLFGENDITARADQRKMYGLFKCKKSFSVIKGARHSHTTKIQDKEIAEKSLEWFNKYL